MAPLLYTNMQICVGCTGLSFKNLRKYWHAVNICKSYLMEQNKLLNCQQLFFSAHTEKVIFGSEHTVPVLTDRQGGYCIILHF